jgi:phosphoglycerol transferase MdoB-like AlkP superfamily enzyme
VLLTQKQKMRILPSEIQFVSDWKKQDRGGIENNLTGIGKGKNLIMIQVESLQNFVIGRSYHGREITPNLNRLVKEGIYFNNIYDQTAAGNTSDATLLANSSLFPSRKGAVSFLYAQNYFDSLPKVLREKGYTTAVMEAYKKHFWNSETFDKGLGFECQFYEDTFDMTDKMDGFLKGLSDKSFFLQSLEKIERLPAPFYVFMRTLSSHAPFAHITSDIDNFPLDDLEGEIVGYYVRSIHYVDLAIGEFLNKFAESNVLSNTILVVYGDHRARLPSREMKRIGVHDMSEKRKIPLIIYIPNKKLGIENDTFGGLIDVAPTICNILEIDISHTFFLGRDLLNSRESFVIFRDGSYICHNCSVSKTWAQQQLKISDLILERDMIPILRNEVQY